MKNGNKSATAILKPDGHVVAEGDEQQGGDRSAVQNQLIDVQHLYTTQAAFAAMKADGSVLAWGEVDQLEEAEALALRH